MCVHSPSTDRRRFLALLLVKMSEKDTKEEILKVFKLFDDDSTGKISFKNLKRVAKELGENMTDEELQEMIDEADRDGDGEINFDEFVNVVILGGRGSKDKKRSERESEPGDDGGAPASAKKAAAGGAIRTVEVS